MTIKDLISTTGMTQKQFAEYFKIPARTVENWCAASPNARRNCPEYLLELMEYKLRHEGFTFYYRGEGDEYGTFERIGGKIIR